MATERIENLISKEALAQFDELNAKLGVSITGFEKLVAKAVETNKALGGAKTFKQVIDGTKELEQAEKDLTKQKSDLEKQQAKLNQLYTEEAKRIAELKVQQQARNASLKEEVQLNQAAEGSIKQKQVQLKQLQREYDNLSAAERKASQGGELLKNIQALDKELKDLEGTTGRFQRNVGNYANAFASAFGTVSGQLQKIQQQIKSGNNGGQQLQQLQRQEQSLLNITKQLNQEFSSTRQQSRAFQEAVAQIGVEFGHQSAVFDEFKNQVGEGVDTLNDIRDSIKLAASDTRQLDRFIGAATAIAGGFSIAQGAAALFGKENEDVQKALLKVQAVMSILNGLQAIQNELKNKDSVLRKLTGFLIKEETKAIQGQVIATNAAATATNQTASATDSAAKATSRWGIALKSIGIGILLSLIPLVTSAMTSMSKATTKVDKDLEGMGDTALEIADTAIKGLDDEINSLNESLGRTPSVIDKAKKALALLREETKNVSVVIPTNITGIDEAKQAFRDILQFVKTGNTQIDEFTKKAEELQTKIKEAEFLKRLKAADDFLQAEFEANQNAIKNRAELDKDANDRRLDALKQNFEERKILEGQFLSSGKSLLRANLNDELQIIKSNLDLQLSQAGGSRAKMREAEDNARKERIIAERNYQEQLTALYEEAEKRRRKLVESTVQGIVEITGSGLSAMAQSLETITGNSTLERFQLWQREFKAAKDGIVEQLRDLRKELGLTALSTFQDLISFSLDAEKNKIQEQIEALDEKKQKEIEVANATILNADEREKAVSAINLRAQAQREALEKKQQQIDIQKAKFEKVVGAIKVAIDTFQKVAAIKAQAALLLANPITAPLAPLALSQIPIVIASGAIATAGILAQPIPKFAKGTDDAPGGLAVVGDAYRSELMVTPKGELIETPAVPTVMNVPKHSIIFPDSKQAIRAVQDHIAMGGSPRVVDHGKYYKEMTSEIKQELRLTRRAIINKRELHIHRSKDGWKTISKSGGSETDYLTDNLQY